MVEGRDIGSVVAPDADGEGLPDRRRRRSRRPPCRRAGRRRRRATESSLLARDRIDSTRTTSPLTMAADAVHIDSTPYTLEEVVDLIVGLVEGTR